MMPMNYNITKNRVKIQSVKMNNEDINKYLTIVLITYNRSRYLARTLDQFINSPFAKCRFVIQNNSSSDDTISIVHEYKNLYPYMDLVTNKFNIGAGANIMRAVENSDTEYTWIIADDDDYDFSDCEDIISKMSSSTVNLIQVGGHDDLKWVWGMKEATPRNLRKDKYPYFKYSSFIASSIFKTEIFKKYIIEGYRNIGNSYPHMPYLFKIYENDDLVYISKRRIVIANNQSDNYSGKLLLKWWLNTSKLLPSKKEQRECFIEQYDDKGNMLNGMKAIHLKLFRGQILFRDYSNVLKLFSPLQVFLSICSCLVYFFPRGIYRYLVKRFHN